MRFNETVRSCNTAIRMFPGNLIAGYPGFTRATDYFAAGQKAKTAPNVEF